MRRSVAFFTWAVIALLSSGSDGGCFGVGGSSDAAQAVPHCDPGRGPLCLSPTLPFTNGTSQGWACCRTDLHGTIAPDATIGYVIGFGADKGWYGCFPSEQDADAYYQTYIDHSVLPSPTYVLCNQ